MNALSLLARRATVLAIRRTPPVWGTQVYRAMVTNPPKAFAVDAPDGSSDALMDAEARQVDDIIDHASKFEDTAFVRDLHAQQEDARKIFAVDAPDGEADDIHERNVHVVAEVIDFAAEHEDKEKVLRTHQTQDAVRKTMNKRQGYPDY